MTDDPIVTVSGKPVQYTLVEDDGERVVIPEVIVTSSGGTSAESVKDEFLAGEVEGLFAALTATGAMSFEILNYVDGRWSLCVDDADTFFADSLVGALRAATEWAKEQD